MSMEIEFVASGPVEGEPLSAIAVLTYEGPQLSADAEALDAAASGALSRVLAAGRFTGAKGQTAEVQAPHGVHAERVVLAGSGPRDELKALSIEEAAAHAYNAIKTSGAKVLELRLSDVSPEIAAHAAFGVRLAAYRFDRYLTKEKPEKKPSVATVRIAVDDPDAVVKAYGPLSALADGVAFTRDLVSEPANILYPAEFARRVKELEGLGLEVEVLGEDEMARLGMGALLGVGQGSRRESQLAVIKWNGAGDGSRPVCFVGKGVTFDSGGISIKPAEGMEDMKWDMGGAGAVAGLMHALAGRKARVNAVGILGLVENMPDGAAQRPGDVVTSMSGQTIEVINTDAEGRLVLADALWYAQETFKPKIIVDLATLTGAMIIALGLDYGGCFSNDDKLAEGLLASARAEGENLWRMPLPSQYDKMLDSLIADMKNIGGRPAGSITAALFLQRFIKEGAPWAHLDIAPVAWKKPSTQPLLPEGATGYGVRLLNRLVADLYEER
jgi:leucyl aminopeptidase